MSASVGMRRRLADKGVKTSAVLSSPAFFVSFFGTWDMERATGESERRRPNDAHSGQRTAERAQASTRPITAATSTSANPACKVWVRTE